LLACLLAGWLASASMAPAWWAIDASSSSWCPLGEDLSAQAAPFQHVGGRQARPSTSFFELAGGAFQPRTHQRADSAMVVSFASKSDKQGAAAIEEKMGKDTDGNKLEPDSDMADDMSPELHGKTINKESCRCLPKSVEPPRSAWLLRKAAEGLPASREVQRSLYRQRLDEVESGTSDQLGNLYKAQRFRDYAFEDLHRQNVRTEKAAEDLKLAFAAVKDAYSEGNCQRVMEKAEETGEKIPECHTNFEKAAKEMKEIRSLITPGCKDGAISLAVLQPPSSSNKVAEALAPLAPDLLVAMSRLTQMEVGRYALPQKHIHEFHRFL